EIADLAGVGVVGAPGQLPLRNVLPEIEGPVVGRKRIEHAVKPGDRIPDAVAAEPAIEFELAAFHADAVEREGGLEVHAPVLPVADIAGCGEDAASPEEIGLAGGAVG